MDITMDAVHIEVVETPIEVTTEVAVEEVTQIVSQTFKGKSRTRRRRRHTPIVHLEGIPT